MVAPAPFIGRSLSLFRGEQPIFANLDFAVSPGQTLLLVGPNGSGKSSLLRLMAGLLRAQSGSLHWGEAMVTPGEEHGARLGYLGHQDSIKPSLTVAEDLAFHAELGGGAVTDAALEALDLFGLVDTPGRLLSAGQRRRLALTRLLVRTTPLWLLDEPTNGLDAASIDRFRAIVQQHRKAGGMIVASTHVDLGIDEAHRLDLSDYPPDFDLLIGAAS